MTIETWAEISARHRQEKTEAIEALAQTMTQAEAARALGIARSILSREARKRGIRFHIKRIGRKPKFSDDELRKALSDGLSGRDVAKKFGCHEMTIYNRARDAGIPMPGIKGLRETLKAQMDVAQERADFDTLLKNKYSVKEALISIKREDLIQEWMV